MFRATAPALRTTSRPGRRITWKACLGGGAIGVLMYPHQAAAHGSEGGIILLLPTGYYLFGSAFVVAMTFLLISLLPNHLSVFLHQIEWKSPAIRLPRAEWASLTTFLLLALMVIAGFTGTRDPLDNPLPAFIWTVWWVCFTLVQAVIGPLWKAVNPWSGPLRLTRRFGGATLGLEPVLPLPQWLGYGIAILQFYAFGWFELVDPSPSDPARLAIAVTIYVAANLIAMMLFGEREWADRAEPFSILFSLIGALAPLQLRRQEDRRFSVSLCWPGKRLFERPPLPTSAVLLVLLALATVSFDGLSRTFVWLAQIGINPLDFPGRSAIVLSSSVGIIVAFLCLAATYYLCVALGNLMSRHGSMQEMAGRLVYSILPISVVFQLAHYLTMVLVDLQNFARATADPFALGWNLTGLADWHVTTSFLNRFDTVALIFNIQTAAVAGGHVLAVILAHAINLDMLKRRRLVFLSELPFAALMVFYTAFGLWLLSTPRI